MRLSPSLRMSAWLLLAAAAAAAAAEDDIFSDEDLRNIYDADKELAADSADSAESAAPPQPEARADSLPGFSAPTVGGEMRFRVEEERSFRDDLPERADTSRFGLNFDSKFYIHSRPLENFRADAKFQTLYDAGTGAWDFRVIELFSDFNVGRKVFVRTGKHVIKWGVCQFFNPTDVLNVVPYDPLDLYGTVEGPVSVRLNVPVDLDNFYAFAILNKASSSEDIAYAAKYEFVYFDRLEASLSGFYRYDMAPRLMADFTQPLLDKHADLYGEGSWSYGSDNVFMRRTAANAAGLETYRDEEGSFFKAALGLRVKWDAIHLVSSLEYSYNQEGYGGTMMREAALMYEWWLPRPAALPPVDTAQRALLFGGRRMEAPTFKPLSLGRHYAAYFLALDDIAYSDINFYLTAFANLSDESVFLWPSLSYDLGKFVRLMVEPEFRFGGEEGEFHNDLFPWSEKGLNLRFTVIVGSGKF